MRSSWSAARSSHGGPSRTSRLGLGALEPGSLKGLRAAAFDTRAKLFLHGDAAKKIGDALEAAGAELIAEPAGFYVAGKEGPLLEGELERAEQWGTQLAGLGAD